MTKRSARMSTEELQAHDAMMVRAIPLGSRLGDPGLDLAPVLVLPVGEGARSIIGKTLPVDGGLMHRLTQLNSRYKHGVCVQEKSV